MIDPTGNAASGEDEEEGREVECGDAEGPPPCEAVLEELGRVKPDLMKREKSGFSRSAGIWLRLITDNTTPAPGQP